MAIEKKRMQQRYGTHEQFIADSANLLPNEFASVISGDPNTDDGTALYIKIGAEQLKRLLFSDELIKALEDKMDNASNTVKTHHIDDYAVTALKIKNGTITELKLAPAVVEKLNNSKIADEMTKNILYLPNAEITGEETYIYSCNDNHIHLDGNRKSLILPVNIKLDPDKTYTLSCQNFEDFGGYGGFPHIVLFNKGNSLWQSQLSGDVQFPLDTLILDSETIDEIHIYTMNSGGNAFDLQLEDGDTATKFVKPFRVSEGMLEADVQEKLNKKPYDDTEIKAEIAQLQADVAEMKQSQSDIMGALIELADIIGGGENG